MKYRVFDLALAFLFLVPSMGVIIVTSLLVVFLDRHPPFFLSKRIGRCENDFWIIKTRAMAGQPPVAATSENMSHYVTPLGRFLRKFSLDEVPQMVVAQNPVVENLLKD